MNTLKVKVKERISYVEDSTEDIQHREKKKEGKPPNMSTGNLRVND